MTQSNGSARLDAERARQITIEGWTPEHDDEHAPGELSRAAWCYERAGHPDAPLPPGWPWAREWWKPKDRESNLIRAGGLYQAERDRAQRDRDRIASELDQLAGNPVLPERTVRVTMGLDDEHEQLYAYRAAAPPDEQQQWPQITLDVPASLWADHDRSMTSHGDTLSALAAFAFEQGYDVENGSLVVCCDTWDGAEHTPDTRWRVAIPYEHSEYLEALGWFGTEDEAQSFVAQLPDSWEIIEHATCRTAERSSVVVDSHTLPVTRGRCSRCGFHAEEHEGDTEGDPS